MKILPKDHRVWVTYLDADNNPRFQITSDPARSTYHLWKVTPDGCERLGKSPSPDQLTEQFSVMDEIHKTIKEQKGK